MFLKKFMDDFWKNSHIFCGNNWKIVILPKGDAGVTPGGFFFGKILRKTIGGIPKGSP